MEKQSNGHKLPIYYAHLYICLKICLIHPIHIFHCTKTSKLYISVNRRNSEIILSISGRESQHYKEERCLQVMLKKIICLALSSHVILSKSVTASGGFISSSIKWQKWTKWLRGFLPAFKFRVLPYQISIHEIKWVKISLVHFLVMSPQGLWWFVCSFVLYIIPTWPQGAHIFG